MYQAEFSPRSFSFLPQNNGLAVDLEPDGRFGGFYELSLFFKSPDGMRALPLVAVAL